MAKRSLEDRFWAKVSGASVETCWVWTGTTNDDGYGIFYLDRRTPRRAHRVSYELLVGDIPDGLQLDHLWHAEPVTNRVNTIRGVGPRLAKGRQLSKTHCKNNHPLSGSNLRVNEHGHRICRTCKREFMRKKCPPTGSGSLGPLVPIVFQVGLRAELACGHVIVRSNGVGAKRARCTSCNENGIAAVGVAHAD